VKYGEEIRLSDQALDYIDGQYRNVPAVAATPRQPLALAPTSSNLLGDMASTLMPTRGSIEISNPIERSQGTLLRMTGIILISLPISYGLVRLVLKEATLAPILLLWGLIGVIAGIWLNRTDYAYSANGVEREKVAGATEIALTLVKREYDLREKTVATYAELEKQTMLLEAQRSGIPRMPFDDQLLLDYKD
jgi:hypothetical protein